MKPLRHPATSCAQTRLLITLKWVHNLCGRRSSEPGEAWERVGPGCRQGGQLSPAPGAGLGAARGAGAGSRGKGRRLSPASPPRRRRRAAGCRQQLQPPAPPPRPRLRGEGEPKHGGQLPPAPSGAAAAPEDSKLSVEAQTCRAATRRSRWIGPTRTPAGTIAARAG